GESLVEDVRQLGANLGELEHLLRFESEVAGQPASLVEALRMLAAEAVPSDRMWQALLEPAWRGALERRLAAVPELRRQDPGGIDDSLDRPNELMDRKRSLAAQKT